MIVNLFDKIVADIAYKKYGPLLGMLKLKWYLIDDKNTFPISYNSKMQTLVVKCLGSGAKIQKRYEEEVLKEKVKINCFLEIKKIKFIE